MSFAEVLKGGVRPEEAGVRPIAELAGTLDISGAGERLKAIRDRGGRFRERFKAGGQAVAARTCGANRFPWPKDYAFFRAPLPDQRPWFVADALSTVRTGQVCVVDGDFELGEGVAFLFTPGHTAGNQSLVLNAPRGVFTLSENGVAPDSYNPAASKIPGLREAAERDGWECIVNGNAIESLVEQYTSMVKEKAVADRSAKAGDFFNTYQSSQMIVSTLSPGVEPAFEEDEIDFGDWR